MTTRQWETLLLWVLFLPLGIAVNAVFLWGVRDITITRTPIGIAFDVLWFLGMYLLYRRWRRAVINDPHWPVYPPPRDRDRAARP